MHTCELFSIRKSKADFDALEASFDKIVEELAEQGVEVRFKTDVSADPKKLSAAVEASLQEGSTRLYLFANALNTSDSSSFKSLFYEFIAAQEAGLTPDEAHAGESPKLKIFSLGDLGNGYKGYCFRNKSKVFIAVPYASLTGKELTDLLCEAIGRTADVLNEKHGEYPDGIVYRCDEHAGAKGRKKKESFLMSFIPRKSDSRNDVVRKVIVLVALVAFVVSAVYLVNFLIESNSSLQDNSEIQMIAHRGEEDPADATGADGEALPSEDWDALKKVNSEIVGWINLPGTAINYPVLQHKGDDQSYHYYLNHSYKNDYSDYGAIYVDYRSSKGVKSKNVIIHGHNISMPTSAMFHDLLSYSSGFTPNMDFYKKHAVITFNTPEGDAKWKIISVFKTSTLFSDGEFFNYMQGKFNSDAEFMNFVYNVRIRSLINTPVTVNETDQILTLSTCSYEYKNWRTVVVARKVRKGEDENVDVKKATVNDSPLFPQIYYGSGTRPDPLTFKTAYSYGRISWYDGKGDPADLEGSEDLTDTIAANAEHKVDANGVPITDAVYYTVIYRNVNNKQLAAYTVRKGDPVPVPNFKPTYDDENYTYTFVDWNFDVAGVDFKHLNASVTIYPKYTYTRKAAPTEPPSYEEDYDDGYDDSYDDDSYEDDGYEDSYDDSEG